MRNVLARLLDSYDIGMIVLLLPVALAVAPQIYITCITLLYLVVVLLLFGFACFVAFVAVRVWSVHKIRYPISPPPHPPMRMTVMLILAGLLLLYVDWDGLGFTILFLLAFVWLLRDLIRRRLRRLGATLTTAKPSGTVSR